MSEELIQRQLEAEQYACDLGTMIYRNQTQTAEEKGRADETAYGKQIVQSYVVAFSELIAEFQTMTGRGSANNRPRRLMKGLDPLALAYRTVSIVLSDAMSGGAKFASSSRNLGVSIRLDMIAEEFRKQHPAYYDRMIKEQLRNTNSEAHIGRVVVTKAAHLGVDHDVMTVDEATEVGQCLVTLLVERFDLFVEENNQAKKKAAVIHPSTELVDWITRANGYLEELNPQQQPMVAPPLDWDETGVGGYYSYPMQKRTPFVRGVRGGGEASVPTKDVRRAVNAIQSTRWRVNKEVYLIQQAMFDVGGGRGLPSMEPVEFLPSPTAGIPLDLLTEEQQQQLEDWKSYKRAAIQRENKRKSKALSSVRMLRTAEQYVTEEAIYFPHNVDFRCRIYPIPDGLQPQGNDQAKGLLEFADGMPLGTHEAVKVLAVHGAGVFGYDKDTMDGRYDWIIKHEDMILLCADDPFSCEWWLEADKPWQFLAFCYEWAGYKREGLDYETRLPCARDGSCNGIQHFSAVLLDEVGGAAVNVTPSDKPNDIYGTVAGVVRERLCELAAGDKGSARRDSVGVDGEGEATDGLAPGLEGEVYSESALADLLLSIGIDRKVTKRPVMIVPYNGTKSAVRSYLIEALVEKEVDQTHQEQMFPMATVLTNAVWDAIGEVVVAARGAMDWIAESTRVIMSEAAPSHLSWLTPTGFEVRQVYNTFDTIRVQTMIREYKIRKRVNYAETTDDPSPRKHKQSTSPNWVHSMDAAHLMLTVNRCLDRGVNDFAMVHDSYGVRAPEAHIIDEELREAFITMHSERQLTKLKEYWEERYGVELPDLPPDGDLELEEVRNSVYFFA